MAYYVKKNGQLEKIAGNVSISQADWNETDDRKITKIKNQPETLKTLDAVVENSNENALVGANAMKELTTTVAGMGSELIKTSAKVNLLANSDLGINVVEKGENINLNDSANSKLVEFGLYGKAVQNTTTGKNLLQYPFYEKVSKTSNGITFTENKDGTITANGTATANATFIFQHRNDNKMLLGAGEYKVNGCPNGGSTSTYRLVTGKTSDSGTYEALITEYGSGGTFTLTKDTDIYIAFDVIKGTTVSNLMIRPMIRLASITDDTWEPYTGGIPSPNPEYPQDIVVSGKSYNLIPYPYTDTTKTVNGVTFTDNKDGTITVNGTATGVTYFSLSPWDSGSMYLDAGEYIYSGCPVGGSSSTYGLGSADHNNANFVMDFGTGNKITMTDRNKRGAYIIVYKGATLNNIIFKPMLRKASVKNDRYMPYGKGSVEVKSCGKNLLPYPACNGSSYDKYGINFVQNEDGSITVRGTHDDSTNAAYYGITPWWASTTHKRIPLYANKTYKITCKNLPDSWAITLHLRDTEIGEYVNIEIKSLYGDSELIYKPSKDGYLGCGLMQRTVIANEVITSFTCYPMLRLAEIEDNTYQPYKETISTIPTENGLAGIPVDSGGNYTDSNGQQWICDEIVKYADGSGEYVQRVGKVVFDGSEDESWGKSGIASNISYYISKTTSGSFNAGDGGLGLLCNRFQAFKTKDLVEKDTVGCSYGYAERGELRIGLGLSSEVNTIDLFRTWLSSNPVEMVYQLKTPSRTPLTKEQLAEIEKLKTFYLITNITNDFDCGMKVKYIADSKIYVDKKIALQSQAQEESLMSMFMLLPDSVQAAMIENDTNNLLKESGV